MYVYYIIGPCSVKRRAQCFCENYRLLSAFAIRAGCPVSKLFDVFKFSACQRTVLPVDPGGCLTLYQTTNFRLFQIGRVCRRQFQN